MRLVRLFVLVLASLFGLASPISQAALPVAVNGSELPSLAPVLEQSTPAVVNIFTRSTVTVRQNPILEDPFFRKFFDVPQQPRKRKSQNLGSGVIVDANKGYILTNNHVIQDADQINAPGSRVQGP